MAGGVLSCAGHLLTSHKQRLPAQRMSFETGQTHNHILRLVRAPA
jgi:hypothetical protein